MTEKTGGSDIANSETIAIPQADGTYKLQGYKFFTSATLSQMSLALARITKPNGDIDSNVRRLFYLTSK
jgi:alkylation response protein AidB-like acyl-CoA dehydrogenase